MAEDAQREAAGDAASTSAKGHSERKPLGRRAEAGARRAAESKATIPHIYATRTVETGELGPDELTAAVIAALARALRDLPALNSSYRDGEIEVHSRINIGLTVEAEQGALLPTLVDADMKTVTQLRTEIAELRARVDAGEITSPELAGGTFAVTAAAEGADSIVPSVIPGQAAHLGIGRPREAAVIRAGAPSVGTVAQLTISYDQRAAGAASAGALLEGVAALLGTPERLTA